MCSVKKVFLKISQISQENTYIEIPKGLQLYLKETPTQLFSCEHYEIFKSNFSEQLTACISEIQTTNDVMYTLSENLTFNFRFTNYFLTCSALQNLAPPNFCLLLRHSGMLNISYVLFFSNLNRLNALNRYQKFVPIDNAQNPSLFSFIYQSCVIKINAVTASLIKVPPLKWVCFYYLRFITCYLQILPK